jgi:hypothetical protein
VSFEQIEEEARQFSLDRADNTAVWRDSFGLMLADLAGDDIGFAQITSYYEGLGVRETFLILAILEHAKVGRDEIEYAQTIQRLALAAGRNL